MPSSVLFNGRRLFRPGVYANVVDNFGAAALPATGNLAVIGMFPELPTATPLTFLNRFAFDQYTRGESGAGLRLKSVAELAFAPFGEGGAAPSSVTFVNALDSVAASYDNGSLTFKSKLHGITGNRIGVQLTVASSKPTLTIRYGNAVVESATLGGVVASVAKGTNTATTLTIAADATKVTVVEDAATTEYLRDDYSSLNAMLDAISADVAGLAIVKAQPDISPDFIDNFTAVNLAGGATASMTANNKAIKDFCDTSAYVSATIDSYAAVSVLATSTRLTGGVSSASSASSLSDAMVQAALNAIKSKPINVVALHGGVDDTDQFLLLSAHCVAAADDAGYERNGWVGTNAATVAAAVSTAKLVNDRNIAVVAQGLTLTTAGDSQALLADSSAVLLAAMQCALPVGSSLTKKKLRAGVVPAAPNTFLADAEATDAIVGGVVVFTDPSSLGASIERSVTSWTGDSNPIKSEVGANQSVNESVRQLRAAVLSRVGERITASTQPDLLRVVNSALLSQRLDGVIFDFADVEVSLAGDTAAVSYKVSPTESLNFILITVNISR